MQRRKQVETLHLKATEAAFPAFTDVHPTKHQRGLADIRPRISSMRASEILTHRAGNWFCDRCFRMASSAANDMDATPLQAPASRKRQAAPLDPADIAEDGPVSMDHDRIYDADEDRKAASGAPVKGILRTEGNAKRYFWMEYVPVMVYLIRKRRFAAADCSGTNRTCSRTRKRRYLE